MYGQPQGFMNQSYGSDVVEQFQQVSQLNVKAQQNIDQYKDWINKTNEHLGPLQQQQYQLSEEAKGKNNFDMAQLMKTQQEDMQSKVTEYKHLLKQVYEKENAEVVTYTPMDLSTLYLYSQQVDRNDIEIIKKTYDIPSFEQPNTIDNVVSNYLPQLLQLCKASQCAPVIKFQKKDMGSQNFIGGCQQIIQSYIYGGHKTMFVIQTMCGNVFGLMYHCVNKQFSINAIKLLSPLENDFDKLPSMVTIPPLHGPQCLNQITVQLDHLAVSFDAHCSLSYDQQFNGEEYFILPSWENINVYHFQ